MTEVHLQYSLNGERISASLGNWKEVPLVGDELEMEGGVLVVKKRRWKCSAQGWEVIQKICLLCELKGNTDES